MGFMPSQNMGKMARMGVRCVDYMLGPGMEITCVVHEQMLFSVVHRAAMLYWWAAHRPSATKGLFRQSDVQKAKTKSASRSL